MARHYGTVATVIWDDDEFRALTPEAQRVYLMLITQVDITSVGTVPITLRRWAAYSPGTTIEGLSMALAELADALFVVIDWDRETLLVRSFVRWDHGYKNAKRLEAIKSAAIAERSPLLSGVLAHELNRLDIKHGITTSPIDRPSIGHRTPIDPPRSVVTYVTTDQTHNPHSGNREPQDSDVPSAPPAKAQRGTRIADDFTITPDMRAWAHENVPGMDIDFTTKKFVLHFQAQSGQRGVMISWEAAWKKWMLSDYKPAAVVNGQKRGYGLPGERRSLV